MANENKLKVLIIGSGLAGLTAARILREHHHVTVYERGDIDVSTGGQGLIVAPNGVKILQSIGYDNDRAGGVPIRGFRMYDKAGNVMQDTDMDLKEKFGAECYGLKRSDFRDELMRLATSSSAELGIGGEPAKIVFNSAVVDLDPAEGVVTLGDGSVAKGDVVIVADGVHSRLRNIITGSTDHVAKKTGLTCYRIAVSIEDAEKALGDGSLPHWWDPSTCRNRTSLTMAADGTSRMVVAYPLRRETYFNLSCIVQTSDSSKPTTDSWNADGDQAKLLETFRDFNEPLRKVLSAATEVKVWELQDLDPLPTWTRGRAMLIGDAAHAMTPMQGQGANMSIEDGESLRLLAPGTRCEEVHDILKLAEYIRRPRAKKVLAETRKAHSTAKVAENANRNDDNDRNMEFNYGYNGIHAALEAEKGETRA